MKIGDLVRFKHEHLGGPVHRVVSVMQDGMIELHDMGGYFAPHLFTEAARATFRRGDRVRKKKGASWQGAICGEYSTSLTPEGYAVESERERGSVQIYPAEALELVESN